MADEEEGAPAEEQQKPTSSSSSGPADSEPSADRPACTEEPQQDGGVSRSLLEVQPLDSFLDQFKLKKFFVLRPGTLNQAIKDVQALVNKEIDGSVLGIWLVAELWDLDFQRKCNIYFHQRT